MSMTTTQRLSLLETAQETIGILMAELSADIWKESHKSTPDEQRIDALELEFDAYMEARDALRLSDVEGLRRALDKYGPLARASMAKNTVAFSETVPA